MARRFYTERGTVVRSTTIAHKLCGRFADHYRQEDRNDMPDMLVKLYELPRCDELFARLANEGVDIRRSIPPREACGGEMGARDLRRGLGQRKRGRIQQPSGLVPHRHVRGQDSWLRVLRRHLQELLWPDGRGRVTTRARHWQSSADCLPARHGVRGLRLRHHRRGRPAAAESSGRCCGIRWATRKARRRMERARSACGGSGKGYGAG